MPAGEALQGWPVGGPRGHACSGQTATAGRSGLEHHAGNPPSRTWEPATDALACADVPERDGVAARRRGEQPTVGREHDLWMSPAATFVSPPSCRPVCPSSNAAPVAGEADAARSEPDRAGVERRAMEERSRTSTRGSRAPSACCSAAPSAPSGETAIAHTGSGNRSRRTSRRDATSRMVTVPAVPPVAKRRPPRTNAIASAGSPSRAGKTCVGRLVRRSSSATTTG